MVYKCTRRRRCAPPPIRVRSASLSLRPLRLPSSCVYRLALPKMLIQGLGCSLQNEATITASIQMPLDLTFHARRELPFQVPANQMDGVPAIHSCPASSGPAWVGPFSSPQCAMSPGEKAVQIGTLGITPSPLPRHVASRCMRAASLFPSLSTPPPLPTLEQTSRKSLPDLLISGCSGALFWPMLAAEQTKPVLAREQTKKSPSSAATRSRRTTSLPSVARFYVSFTTLSAERNSTEEIGIPRPRV